MSNVIVLTPAASRALTTVEIVREDLGISPAAMTNERVQRMIDAASATAAIFCRRQFGIQTVRERIAFTASSGLEPMEKIVVANSPIVAIQSISANGDIVDPLDYEANETSIFNLDDNGDTVPWYGRSFTLIYQGGYLLPGQNKADFPASAQPLPADISRAITLLIAANASGSDRDVMIKAEETEGVGRTEYYVQGAKAQLPHPEAESILQAYQWAKI